MSKYEPLGKYLKNIGKYNIELTFDEIEKILHSKLPAYLYKYVAGWYGSAEASPMHRQKVVWHNYGYRVETVNLSEKKVIFGKIKFIDKTENQKHTRS